MKAITIRRFSVQDSSKWNGFVKAAKNATFLFDRNYMDYHSDRFADHSAMVYEGETLRAIFPAHEDGSRVTSHGGLTYGGLLLQVEVQFDEAMCFFYHLLKYYREAGFESMLYKIMPQHYCTYPTYEDQYAMFRLEANLVRRDLSCVYGRSKPLLLQKREKVNRAMKECTISKSSNPTSFWANVLIPHLQERFKTSPVHTASEIKLLMERFPDNIHLYETHNKEEIMGGALLFESETTAHLQYTSATVTGKEVGALDFLFHHLITEEFAHKEFFSFGTSNGEGGEINQGLLDWKESFGARVHTLDVYQIRLANSEKLQGYA